MDRPELAGILPVDKPEGPTSHDIVAAARRALGTRRIGHTGTLDPFASGLLLLCVGTATRLAEYLTSLPKAYRAVARLGSATDTDDATGRVITTSERWREISADDVDRALRAQMGARQQVPPAYSAKRVEGERLYTRARRGEVVQAAAVPVVIHAIVVVRIAPPDVEFDVDCSSGTYIRAIARDLGDALGTGAHLVTLRRTRIGTHDVSRALTVDRISDADAVFAHWLSPLEALRALPCMEVGEREARAIAHGVAVPASPEAPAHGVLAISREGRLIAVAEVREGLVRPRKVLVGG